MKTFVDLETEWLAWDEAGRKNTADKDIFISNLLGPAWLDACRSYVAGETAPPNLEVLSPLLKRSPLAYFLWEAAKRIREERAVLSQTIPTDAMAALSVQMPKGERFSRSFLDDIAAYLSGQEIAPLETRITLFPVVIGSGYLARFRLEQMPFGVLDGVYINPKQAFMDIDSDFDTIFSDVPKAITAYLGIFPTGPVRVSIDVFDPAIPQIRKLKGSSGGGALLLGVASLWSQKPLSPGFVTSLALRGKSSVPDGNTHPIGQDIQKAQAIANEKGGRGVFLVSAAQGSQLSEASAQMLLPVESPRTLDEAFQIATGDQTHLLAYLEAVRQMAARAPGYYPVAMTRDTAYVKLRAFDRQAEGGRGKAAERERLIRGGLDPDKDRSRVYQNRSKLHGDSDTNEEQKWQSTPPPLEWDKIRGKIRKAIIVGDPGMGKSWLLKHEAGTYAQELIDTVKLGVANGKERVPFFCHLSKFDDNVISLTMEEAVASAALRTLPNPLNPGLHKQLVEKLRRGEAIVLLDALDEVTNPLHKTTLLRRLEDWVPRTQNLVLLTSRSVHYTKPWRTQEWTESERELELLRLEPVQIEAFVRRFYFNDDARAAGLLELLKHNTHLRGQAQIPLLLGFICALFTETRIKLDRFRRVDLYQKVLEKHLQGEWHDERLMVTVDDAQIIARINLMAETAYLLFHERKELFLTQELLSAICKAAKRLGSGLSQEAAAAEIEQWQTRDGILVKAGGEGKSKVYLFQHLTFQEYLTAFAIWRKLEEGTPAQRDTMIAYLSYKAWSPDWEQVLLLLAGLAMNSPHISRFYRLLMDEQLDDIACSRQVLAAQMLAETVVYEK